MNIDNLKFVFLENDKLDVYDAHCVSLSDKKVGEAVNSLHGSLSS